MNEDDEQAVRELVEAGTTTRAMSDRLLVVLLREELAWERARRRDAGMFAWGAWVLILLGIGAKIAGWW